MRWTLNKLLKGAGAGADPTLIDVPGPTTAYKAADETINNSNVLQNDDDLYLAMAANEVWVFEGLLIYECNEAADFQACVVVPVAADLNWQNGTAAKYTQPYNALGLSYINATSGAAEYVGGAAYHCGFWFGGVVINGANAGNLQVQWAQWAAHASDLIVHKGSFLIATKMN